MKKIITLFSIAFSTLAFSQVKIGKTLVTAANPTGAISLSSPSVLLEFGETNSKGLVLPYVETVPAEGTPQAKGGTLIFDVSATGEYKVKVKNENAGWTDLSVQSGYSAAVESSIKTTQTTSLVEASAAKVIIGASTSASDGVLVLESSNKAMVLPIIKDKDNVVAQVNEIVNPAPGMMIFFDNNYATPRLAVFNGKAWTFWMANP